MAYHLSNRGFTVGQHLRPILQHLSSKSINLIYFYEGSLNKPIRKGGPDLGDLLQYRLNQTVLHLHKSIGFLCI